ncbi:hypothetical protein [Streptomyces sp. NPDC056683]
MSVNDTPAIDYRHMAAVALVRDAASQTLGDARFASRLRDWAVA